MSDHKVCPKKLAAFDARAAAAKVAASVDYVSLLQMRDHSPAQRELALRQWRTRGIDDVVKELKKTLPKDEATALARYLRQCPRVDALTAHILEYEEAKPLIAHYIPKLHRKITTEN